MKVVSYRIVSGTVLTYIEEEINDLISHGYQPRGKLKSDRSAAGNRWYIQVMVKYEVYYNDYK